MPNKEEEKELPKNPLWAVLRYAISIAIGAAIVLIYIFSMINHVKPETTYALYKIIADGFTLSGVILMGVGLLVIFANNGIFNFLNYTFQWVLSRLIHSMKAAKQSYGDFLADRGKKKVPWLFLLAPGAIYFTVGMVFVILFYVSRDAETASSAFRVLGLF